MDAMAVSASPTSIDAFRVSAAGLLRHSRFLAGHGWPMWANVSQARFPAHQTVCAVGAGGSAHAFVVDGLGGIHHFVSPSTFTITISKAIPGVLTTAGGVAAAYVPGGPLHVFARVQDRVAAVSLVSGVWSAPVFVGAQPITSGIADLSLSAVVQPGGTIHLFCSGKSDGLVWHTALAPAAAYGQAVWSSVGADPVNGRPCAAARSATSIDVATLDPFAITVSDHAIAAGAWQPRQYSDQDADSQPVRIVALSANSLAVIGYGEVGAGSGVIVSRVTIDAAGKATWGAWQLVPGDLVWDGTELCALLRADRYLDLFVNHIDGMVTTSCDTAAATWTWPAWQTIPSRLLRVPGTPFPKP